MFNASLNFGSLCGIALAVGGALLYFMRSFKPALARDYDVFFSAVGLLCGGILLTQSWRLDPILQFGVFLLSASTGFFAFESVRLRGVSVEQARRSAYFDDEPAPGPSPAGGLNGGWDSPYDRFDDTEPEPLRRRFQGASGDDYSQEGERDFYRPRRQSRAAIPEQAASRRRGRDDSADSWDERSEQQRRMARFGRRDEDSDSRSNFGSRRTQRQDQRRGSRPSAARADGAASNDDRNPRERPGSPSRGRSSETPPTTSSPAGIPQGTPLRQGPEDAAFSPSKRGSRSTTSPGPGSSRPSPQTGSQARPGSNRPENTGTASGRPAPRSSRPRDNSSRFDD